MPCVLRVKRANWSQKILKLPLSSSSAKNIGVARISFDALHSEKRVGLKQILQQFY